MTQILKVATCKRSRHEGLGFTARYIWLASNNAGYRKWKLEYKMTETSDQVDKKQGSHSELLELDATGLFCPEPVMLLHNKIRDMAPGDLLQLIATDPSTTRDVPKFCHYLGHELVESSEQQDKYRYLIRKSEE